MDTSYFTIANVKDGAVNVTRAPVEFSIVRPGETILPDSEPETLVASQ
jgi:fumarate reductase flavoprotein subunit